MLYAACGTAGAVALSYYAGSAAAAAAAMLLFTSAVLLGREKARGSGKSRIAWIVLVFYCLGAVSFMHTDRILKEEAGRLTGSFLQGDITDCVKKTGGAGDPYLQLTVKSEDGRVIARWYGDIPDGAVDTEWPGFAAEGRRAVMTGNLQDPSVKRNPGCFDYALYLKSYGVTKVMTCDSAAFDPVRPFRKAPVSFIRNRICAVREGFIRRLTDETDPAAGAMMRAIMFGDKGGLDEETLETFQKNGTAHILAVSGLHIGIIYGFILKLWRWRRGWGFFSFNLIFFIMYASAAGFSPSVTRAVVMVLLHILAGIRGWRYDLSSGAFAVAVLVLLQNPYMLFNTGFQMSFLAVLTLVLVLPYIKKFYSGVFLASLAVQIGLGPFTLYSFHFFSLLAVFINVPVAALAGMIVPAGLISLVAGSIGASVSGPADEAVGLLCRILKALNEAGQIDGITTVTVPSPPLWAMASYYLCLLMFATEEGRLMLLRSANRGKYVLRMLLVIVLVSAGFQAFASDGLSKCDLTFVDVGQGDCMHLRVDDSARLFRKNNIYSVLIDGGGRHGFDAGKKILRPYLLKTGVGKIDLAIVTHLHNDHYDGIRSLCRMGMVKRLCVYEGYKTEENRILTECGLKRSEVIYAAAGDVITLGDASFTMLAPPALREDEYVRLSEAEEDENKRSLLIKVSYHGVTAMMTGDIGEEGERDAMEQAGSDSMKCDILKVGHHGSKTSTCDLFLDEVKPSIAVIQVGENNMYGHPAPDTLQRLSDAGVPVYRNDLQGAVGIEIRNGNVRSVRTMIHEG